MKLHSRNLTGAQCGVFHGRSIDLYRFAVDTKDAIRSCGDPALVLAHELGHVLGLDDVSTDRCPNHIMSWIDSMNLDRRAVQPVECEIAAAGWRTFAEMAAEESVAEETVAVAGAAAESPVAGFRGRPRASARPVTGAEESYPGDAPRRRDATATPSPNAASAVPGRRKVARSSARSW